MKEQNYKNHVRHCSYVWHIVTGLASYCRYYRQHYKSCTFIQRTIYYSASLLVVVSLILLSLLWYAGAFALRAQDRAIRAEENFRHFILTGKPLDSRLQAWTNHRPSFCK